MGYRSEVYLKTTTEGWIIMKKFNDTIDEKYSRPLCWANIDKTKDGYYRISFSDIKWYDSYAQVQNFERVLSMYEDQDIPYSFIRIGEETDDVECRNNWTDDMPDSISSFEPVVNLNDDDDGSYETVDNPDASPE